MAEPQSQPGSGASRRWVGMLLAMAALLASALAWSGTSLKAIVTSLIH